MRLTRRPKGSYRLRMPNTKKPAKKAPKKRKIKIRELTEEEINTVGGGPDGLAAYNKTMAH